MNGAGGRGKIASVMPSTTPSDTNTVLITGASQGIGLALARAFHQRGDRVLLVARDAVRLDEVAAELPGAVPLPCDLLDPGAVSRLVQEIETRFPGLNILVNNAGRQFRGRIDHDAGFLDASIADLRLNLEAPMRLISLLLPVLDRQPRATIVNVTP